MSHKLNCPLMEAAIDEGVCFDIHMKTWHQTGAFRKKLFIQQITKKYA